MLGYFDTEVETLNRFLIPSVQKCYPCATNSSDIKQSEEVPAGVGNYADLNAVLFTAGVRF